MPPGYGTRYGPQPPGPGKNNKVPLIAAIVVVLLVAAGLTTFFLVSGNDDKKHEANPSPTTSASAPSTPSFPSSTAAPTEPSAPDTQASGPSGDIGESDARLVVDQYLDDINAQNRSDAQTLICTKLVDGWKQKIDQPGGDFTVTITDKSFQDSSPSTEGLDLKYSLSVKSISSGQTGTSDVTFTVVQDSGLKICGEQ